jgi:2',3'-cyclic-nucleotide 2'-phosphodiesterase (5'-nucleotidase family)
MSPRRQRLLLALAAPFLLVQLSCARPRPATEARRGAPLLVIDYFNDWHGHLESFTRPGATSGVGGAGRLGALIAARREAAAAAGADSLLLEAGDILQGTPMSTVFRGEPDFALLQRFGVDAMAMGNHELDYGQATLAERVAQVRFPVLAANVRKADGSLLTGGDAVVLHTPRHGLDVAILGLVTPDVAVTTHPHNAVGLAVEDPVTVARRYVPDLARRSDLVVVLSHCGEVIDRELAAIDGVDVVVGGHDQKLLEPTPVVGGVRVVQAYEWGEYLGEVRFVAGARGRPVDGGNRYFHVTQDLPEDAEITAYVAGFRERLAPGLAKVVATTALPLDGGRDSVRRHESNFGDLVADALRTASGAELALVNAGTIRGSIEAGPITLEELMTVMPFENRIMVVALSGAEVRAMVERSIRTQGGGFLQVSGLRVDARAPGPPAIDVGGAPLEDDRVYQVAITDYLLVGGDGYGEPVGKTARDTGLMLLDAVRQWIESQPTPFLPRADGRLKLGDEAALPDAA